MSLARVESQADNIHHNNIFDILQRDKCETCNFVFKSQEDLNSHIQSSNHKSSPHDQIRINMRKFNYSLTSAKAKANLLKSAKSNNLEIKYNQKSIKLIFSAGMYQLVVLPLLNAFEKWDMVEPLKGNGLIIYLVSLIPGRDLSGNVVDSKVELMVNNVKVTFHAYNTTQNVKVEGAGYLEFVEKFLKPLLASKSNEFEAEIEDINNDIIEKLGTP